MAIHLQRYFVFASTLLLLVYYVQTASKETPGNSDESDEEDSSSEETVTESGEKQSQHRRRKRSTENETGDGDGDGDGDTKSARAGIPGVPNPATIIKIAEIVQTVGEQVIPILLEGKPPRALFDFTAERFNRNFQFLQNFQRQIDTFIKELQAQ